MGCSAGLHLRRGSISISCLRVLTAYARLTWRLAQGAAAGHRLRMDKAGLECSV